MSGWDIVEDVVELALGKQGARTLQNRGIVGAVDQGSKRLLGAKKSGQNMANNFNNTDHQWNAANSREEQRATRADTGNTTAEIRNEKEHRKQNAMYGNEPYGQSAFAGGTSPYYQPLQAPDLSNRDVKRANALKALHEDNIPDEQQQKQINKLERKIGADDMAQIKQYDADRADRETASAAFDKHMQAAFAAPVDSQERREALAEALADAKALQNAQGTGVTFPNSALNYLPQQEARPEASNRRGHPPQAPVKNPLVFGSAEAAMLAVSNKMVADGVSGNGITAAELRNVALKAPNPPAQTNGQANNGTGAGANTGTAGDGTGTNTPNTGTNSPTANGAGNTSTTTPTTSLSAGDGTAAKAWGGVTIPHGLSQNQVVEVQQMLVDADYGKNMPTKTSATGVDTMYGTRTNAALMQAAKDAGVDLSKIDFASKDNPELLKLTKHLQDKAAAKGQSTSKADETKEQTQDIAGNNPQPGEQRPNPPAGNDNADITKKPAPALQTKTPTEAELKTAAGNEAAAAVAASAGSRMSFLKEVATTLGFDGNGDEATLTKNYEKAIGVANPNGQLEASEVAIGEKKFEELAETRAAAYEDPFSKALADAKKYGLANGSIRHDVNADGPNGIPSVGKPTADMGRGTSVNQ
jgi:hypothetical protein